MEKKGAEATVKIGERVAKIREKKNYRHEEIDRKLREERTEQELRLMEDAGRHGVNVPEATQKGKTELELERIEGEPLKNIIGERLENLEELGENIAYMHSTDIIHGDLTTSNVLIAEKPYVIDFGLSFRSRRVEDKAVDIHLFRQVLESSHPEVSDNAWEKFVEGYREYEDSGKVLEQLEEVEQRGRYK